MAGVAWRFSLYSKSPSWTRRVSRNSFRGERNALTTTWPSSSWKNAFACSASSRGEDSPAYGWVQPTARANVAAKKYP